MSVIHLLAALRRHPFIAMAGIGITLLIAAGVYRWPGVYQTRGEIVLTVPGPTPLSNPLRVNDDSLVSTAGVVLQVINQDRRTAGVVSESVTLADQGVSRGRVVKMINLGGQWSYDYQRPTLVIEATGSTEVEARRLFDMTVQEVTGALDQLQDSAGAPARGRIEGELIPADPVVVYSTGRRSRGVAAAFLLGAGLTSAAAVMAGPGLRRRGWSARRASN